MSGLEESKVLIVSSWKTYAKTETGFDPVTTNKLICWVSVTGNEKWYTPGYLDVFIGTLPIRVDRFLVFIFITALKREYKIPEQFNLHLKYE